jgi:hypothetical protein
MVTAASIGWRCGPRRPVVEFGSKMTVFMAKRIAGGDLRKASASFVVTTIDDLGAVPIQSSD